MKKILLITLVSINSVTLFAQVSVKTNKTFFAKIVKVIDGDTIDASTKDSTIRIRLFAIDAPEKGQDFYFQSKESMQLLVLNKIMHIEIIDKDRFGRMVAIIYRAEDNMNINYEMVRRGMAWHFTKYSKDPQLARLQLNAREKEWGLWSKYYFIEPWEFRKSKH